jgi:enoyl-CoA hydratase/carnithine racemase
MTVYVESNFVLEQSLQQEQCDSAVAGALGERRATELALSGRIFPAGGARECGLVHHVVEPAGLMERAREIAGAIAESSPTAIRAGLAFVRDARSKSWEEAGDLARRMRNEVFRSADFQEGIRAFQEKRPPRWSGGQDSAGIAAARGLRKGD